MTERKVPSSDAEPKGEPQKLGAVADVCRPAQEEKEEDPILWTAGDEEEGNEAPGECKIKVAAIFSCLDIRDKKKKRSSGDPLKEGSKSPEA